MSGPNPYHRLTASAKQVRQRESMREPSVPCPHCEASTTAEDLLRHVESSCPGQREPHTLSKWITRREAMDLGVPSATLHRWLRGGRVRSRVSVARDDSTRGRGRPAGRRYLMRDITKLVALRRRIIPMGEKK